MIVGVIGFSFATGSLTSIIQNYESQNAKLSEQMATLNRLVSEYDIPPDLFSRLKMSLEFSSSHDTDNLN